MSKGVMLTMDTIVIIVLAAVVLIALLIFFSSQEREFSSTYEALLSQQKYCSAYANNDPDCENLPDSSTRDGIKKACKYLEGYPACRNGNEMLCVRQCCRTYCGEEITTSQACQDAGGACSFTDCPAGKTQIGTCNMLRCCK